MADIGGRRYTQRQLERLFRTLDAGGTRDDVRRQVRRLQRRGISNDALRQLRLAHKAVRRSQGYNVKDGGVRRLVDETGELRPLRSLSPNQRLSLSRRPLPPSNLPAKVTVAFPVRRDGRNTGRRRVAVFDVGPDAPSLEAQLAEAAEDMGHGSPAGIRRGGTQRGFTTLRVRSAL